VFILFFGFLFFCSQSLSIADFIIEEGPTNISIIGYTGSGGDVVIPSSISNKAVTVIKSNAFYNQTNIINLTIPSSVISIESNAFNNCHNLKNVYLTNGLVFIGDNAFDSCVNLEKIDIPDTVTSFGENWGSIFFYNTNLKSVRFGEGITNIPRNTFFNCYAITNIHFGSNLKTIQANAFAQCFSLEEVYLPKGVNTIGIQAFWQNQKLKKVIIPATITNTFSAWFGYCTNLSEVIFYGNAPNEAPNLFYNSFPTVYYLCGTIGWSNSFAGRPTAVITASDIINSNRLEYAWRESQEKAFQDARNSTRSEIMNSPTSYGLFSSNDIETARTAGINQVLQIPNNYNLFTSNQILEMKMSGLVVQKTNNQLILRYKILQSTNLTDWVTYSDSALNITNNDSGKLFLRLHPANQ